MFADICLAVDILMEDTNVFSRRMSEGEIAEF
jgi:hypothetical protein